MYSIKTRADLKNLHEFVSLENQVKVLRLQDKLGKQDFHGDLKKQFELVTDTKKEPLKL